MGLNFEVCGDSSAFRTGLSQGKLCGDVGVG